MTVTPNFDPASPASIEVTEQGMYLHIGDVTLDLETGSTDSDAHADALDQAARILQSLAHELPGALADIRYNQWQLGDKCEVCDGHGGQEIRRRFAGEGWDECYACDGKGRIVADRMPPESPAA